MQQNEFSNPILQKKTNDNLKLVKDSLEARVDSTLNLSSKPCFSEPILMTSQQVENPVIPLTSVETSYEKTPWFIAIIIVILILFSKIKLSFPRVTPLVLLSFVKNSEVNKLFNSRNARHKACYLFMNSLSFLVSSVFVFELAVYYKILQEAYLINLLYIMAIVLALALAKIVLANILGFIFRSSLVVSEYVFNFLLVWKTVAMLLIPVVIAIPFVNFSVVYIFNYIGLFIVSLAYILIILRSIKILFLKHVSFLYLILYLCALEMVPLAIAYKYFTASL